MAAPPRAERILAEGRFGTVEYAVRSNGTMEARDWFENQDDATQARLGVLFQMVATREPKPNREQCKHLRGAVYEFKRQRDRMFCFLHGNRWLLTHHALKRTQKTPKREIEKAQKIGEEHIAWEKANRG